MGLISGACANKRVRPIRTTIDGNLQVQISPPTRVRKYKLIDSTNETTIWDPGATEKIIITDIIVSNTNGGTLILRDGLSGATIMILNLAANTGLSINLITPIQLSYADYNLTGQASAASWYVTVCGWVEVAEP
jgi:hypothetical protein